MGQRVHPRFFMNAPTHIAIIMDGNGRWAKRRGLPRVIGHREGVKTVERIVKACVRFGVRYLTLYAFSTENWNRSEKEITALFALLDRFLDTKLELFQKNNIRFCVIGERQRIRPILRKKIEHLEKCTRENDKLILNVALSYGARQEIVNAARALSEEVKKGNLAPSEIDEKLFSQYLYTHPSPDPDILIRTSGEMRVSNFLLWQISYAELYVTEKLWPDFDERDLEKVIDEYNKRERRFGR